MHICALQTPINPRAHLVQRPCSGLGNWACMVGSCALTDVEYIQHVTWKLSFDVNCTMLTRCAQCVQVASKHKGRSSARRCAVHTALHRPRLLQRSRTPAATGSPPGSGPIQGGNALRHAAVQSLPAALAAQTPRQSALRLCAAPTGQVCAALRSLPVQQSTCAILVRLCWRPLSRWCSRRRARRSTQEA